jgi:hypothetical protein
MSEILSKLSEPFPKEVESTLRKGGASLTYIPISEVISRLNNVLGVDGWSYAVKGCHRDSITPDWIIAHVTLTAIIDGSVVHKDGFGGQEVKYMKGGDKPLDLGNEFKGAVSDALKKAAQALGVGIYLARSDEALELEAAEPVDPKVEAAWSNFVSIAGSLSEEQRNDLNKFWVEYSGGRPKPTAETATIVDVTALAEEGIRLSFNATVVEPEEEGDES